MNLYRRQLGGRNRRSFEASAKRVRLPLAALALLSLAGLCLSVSSRYQHTTASTASNSAAIAASLSPSTVFSAETSLPQAAKFPTGGRHLAPSQAKALLAGLPLIFEPNQGQANLDPADSRAKFIARGSGYNLFLGSGGAILSLSSHASSAQTSLRNHVPIRAAADRVDWLQMKLAGANPNVALSAAEPLSGHSNYLLGNDESRWRTSIPQFARVRYENVYPGINLVFYGKQGQLEYDFQVAPGADPRQAELEFDGAQRLKLEDGALVIESKDGSVRFDAPRVYQQVAGREQQVEGKFVLRGAHRAGFAVGAYDRSRELVIDPVLTYSTYFGGTSGNETATAVAVQGGFIYLTGATTSTDLPVTAGVLQGTFAAGATQNLYVAEINPTLGAAGLVYLTYLGGNGMDTPVGLGVDGQGNAYVAGTTSSTNFPNTTNAYQPTIYQNSTGTQHVFVSVLNATATALNYSSYLSGNGTDLASGMAIDAAGHIFVTGSTTSNNTYLNNPDPNIQFPASNPNYAIPLQSAPFAAIQFFVTEVSTINASGAGSIFYSTYFGGGSTANGAAPIANGGGITADVNGNIYFTGSTNFIYTGGQVGDFHILNAYQPCLDTAPPTIIVNPPTCTYTGTTTNFGLPDAFVAKLNPTAGSSSQLQFSTYLGGTQTDAGTGIAVDSAGNVYVTGFTNSPDIVEFSSIVTLGAYQECLNNNYTVSNGVTSCVTTTTAAYDAFIAKFTNPATGTTVTNVSLTYFSFLGGSANDYGFAIAVDTAEGAILTGSTESPAATPPVIPAPSGDLPVSNCGELQCELTGTQDAFIARINTQTNQNGTGNTAASWVSYWGSGTPSTALTQGTSVALDVNQNTYFAGNTNSTSNLPTAKPLQSSNVSGGFDAFVTELGTASNLSITGVLSTGVNQTYIPAGTPATFVYTLTNGGPDLATNITVTDILLNTGVSGTGVQMTPNSITATGGLCTSVNANAQSLSCTINSLQAGSTSTITIQLTPSGTTKNVSVGFNGGSVVVMSPSGTVLTQTQVSGVMSDYSLSVNPNNVSVQTAGDTATYQVQLAPSGIYAANIALSCSGTPTGSTCTFTTPTVTLAGNSPGSTTLNVTTTARPVTPPTASLWKRQYYAILFSIPGLALLGIGAGSSGRRRRAATMLLLCALMFVSLLFLPSCHGAVTQTPVAGTPAGSYPITVTATSGSDTKNYTVNLVVP